MSDLNPTKALIFRIVHRDNMAWIFDNGLHCKSSRTTDPRYVDIGNAELIDKRRHHPVPCSPGGVLSDYVPFYFTPFSPMLYNIKTGYGGIRKRDNDEIVILASSLYKLKEREIRFVFTDRHAYLATAQYYSGLENLNEIDWPILQRRDFKRDPDDPGKFERYQAEALVHQHLPIEALLGIVCYNDAVASGLHRELAGRGLNLTVATKPNWYFR